MNRSILLSLAFCAVANCSPRASLAITPYVITDLGNLLGSNSETTPTAINSRGQVVGESSIGLTHQAFVWSPSSANSPFGSMSYIGDLPGGADFSWATAINDTGQIAGVSYGATANHAFVWTPITPNGPVGSMFDLGELPGGTDYSWAYGMNSYGQVVGESQTENGTRAFLWTPSQANGSVGSMVNLGSFPASNDQRVSALQINSAGQVVVNIHVRETNSPLSISHASVWTPTTANTNVGTYKELPFWPTGDFGGRSIADINDRGQIVGSGSLRTEFGPVSHATLWMPTVDNGSNYVLVDIATSVHRNFTSGGRAINSPGQVVGIIPLSGRISTFLWTPATPNAKTGTLVNLNDLLAAADRLTWLLDDVMDINDQGQIVGTGVFDADGPGGAPPIKKAFLLTPVPEPATATLVLLIVVYASFFRSSSRSAHKKSPRSSTRGSLS